MKIVVLCGGTSPEREVSLSSGAAVAAALREAGFDALLEDVTSVAAFAEQWPALGADAAFVALHGGWGEDGRLQAALECAGIPYTGSGPTACRLAMDKEATREILERNGIPVPPGFAVAFDQACDMERTIERWGRIVVKPASGGSTVGVTITDDPGEARRGLFRVWDIDTKAVVERFVPGAELTVTVFERDGATFALPAIEIRPHSGFYDYASKYTKGATEYLCPAPLDARAAERLADLACRAHAALGCRVYSRIDFRLTETGEPFCLEANTAPGMTATSLVPKAALAYGWDFPTLLGEILRASTANRS